MPEVADKIRFYIGDVRNFQTCENAIYGIDYILHVVVIKQISSYEFFPMKAVKASIIVTNHVPNVAIQKGVEVVICLSSDKAAYPINAMGKTKICCTRYGNVMCSRCSVIRLGQTIPLQLLSQTRQDLSCR